MQLLIKNIKSNLQYFTNWVNCSEMPSKRKKKKTKSKLKKKTKFKKKLKKVVKQKDKQDITVLLDEKVRQDQEIRDKLDEEKINIEQIEEKKEWLNLF